jgi:hypothetical protein
MKGNRGLSGFSTEELLRVGWVSKNCQCFEFYLHCDKKNWTIKNVTFASKSKINCGLLE